MTWQPIETHDGSEAPVLVFADGRVGEAFRQETWINPAWKTNTDDEDDDGPWYQWAWTYHSTCGCCFGPISGPVTVWQPLPEPPK